MSELVVVGFEDTQQADRALTELVRLSKEHLIDLEDAVVAIRSPDGAVRIKQSVNLVGIGAAQGGLSGALWGSLVGLLFLNPLLGFAAGAATGAAVRAALNSGRSSASARAFPPGSRSPVSSASRITRARSTTAAGSPASRATCTP